MLQVMCTLLIVYCSWAHGQDSVPCPHLDGLPACDESARYRTISGVCNNIEHPEWGKTGQPFQRLLDPVYDDGISTPRTESELNATLPGARVISSILDDTKEQSPVYTLIGMTFGQILDHDITRTPGGNRRACQNCVEDVEEDGECFPIHIPDGDPDFTDRECINFVRTPRVKNAKCEDIREQQNKLSSYIDGGFVYGDDDDTVAKLKDGSDPNRGRLNTTPHPVSGLKDLLPQVDTFCRNVNDTIKCFLSGDVRVNQQMGLTAMHIMFHRLHNVIEAELHRLNKQWDGNKLYQEARRIMIAGIQQIVYNEYLPLVLGPDAMSKYKLILTSNGEYWNRYDCEVNPGIFNNFATASYRFGHSQIGNLIRFTDKMYKTVSDRFFANEMFSPLSMYLDDPAVGSGVDAVMLGMASQEADMVDTHMSKQMSVNLFTPVAPHGIGTDLGAINIQRGRDHGLPSYLRWREYCGLTADLADIPEGDRERLVNADSYVSKDDMDLWVGGLAETHVHGALVGPTFACLLGKQFKNIRAGDRFWFEKKDENHGFSRAELREIRKFSLAYLMCATGDRIRKIQPKVMLQPLRKVPRDYRDNNPDLIQTLYGNEDNRRVMCSRIPAPDFSIWKENKGRRYGKGKGKGKGKDKS